MEQVTVNQIFNDRLFRIPDYQRGYAWTKKQLEDFWEDLINLPTGRPHFTGTLSLKEIDPQIYEQWNDEKWLIEKGNKPFYIVDGQQRLTTIVIFIQVFCELVRDLPENKSIRNDDDLYIGDFSLKEIRSQFLFVERPPQKIIKTYRFGYENDNPSFKYLKHEIFKEPDGGSIQETFYTLNLKNAKNFFTENLNKLYELKGFNEVTNLFKKLTLSLKFNIYEISDDFDVFVSFETMNNRGKSLSKLELLKNRLIYLSTLYSEQELNIVDKQALREKINNAWKEIYYQLGRNKTKPLNDDDFLAAHWVLFFQYTREKGDDYINFLLNQKFTKKNIFQVPTVNISSFELAEEFRDNNEGDLEEIELDVVEKVLPQSQLSPKEIETYVNSLKSAAIHWYNSYFPLNNQDLNAEESLWLDRLNRIGIMYFRPLVVASFLNDEVDCKGRVRLFEAVERFIFIAFRLNRSFSSYRNSEFYRVARLLRSKDISVDKVIATLNDAMNFCFDSDEENPDTLYFDYSSFQTYIGKKFKGNPDGGFYQWNGLKYFLYEYEMDKVKQRGSKKIDWELFIQSKKDQVSIEHILPLTPNGKYWKDQFKNCRKEKLKYCQGSLGNLLPLSKSINSSLQNDSFPDKKSPKFNNGDKIRQGYSDGSHSEIEVSAYNDWNPESIYDRGIKLLDFFEKRWKVKFEDETCKAELLFLDFLNKEK